MRLNWCVEGSWWVSIGFEGLWAHKAEYGVHDLVLLVEVVSSITKGPAGIGVMWSHSGHYSAVRVLLGL